MPAGHFPASAQEPASMQVRASGRVLRQRAYEEEVEVLHPSPRPVPSASAIFETRDEAAREYNNAALRISWSRYLPEPGPSPLHMTRRSGYG